MYENFGIKKEPLRVLSFPLLLAILTTCSLRLLLSLNAGLLVMLTSSIFSKYSGTSTLSFEALKGTINGLIFADADLRHVFSPPLSQKTQYEVSIANF